jgi:hypothetical protein
MFGDEYFGASYFGNGYFGPDAGLGPGPGPSPERRPHTSLEEGYIRWIARGLHTVWFLGFFLR